MRIPSSLLLLAIGLQGCATHALHEHIESLPYDREGSLPLPTTMPGDRSIGLVGVGWVEGYGGDTLQVWKFDGLPLWLWRGRSMAILDGSSPEGRADFVPGAGPRTEAILLANTSRSLPAHLLASDGGRRIWIAGRPSPQGRWIPAGLLEWSDGTVTMMGLLLRPALVPNTERVLWRGLYVLSVPLDVVVTPLGFLMKPLGEGFAAAFAP